LSPVHSTGAPWKPILKNVILLVIWLAASLLLGACWAAAGLLLGERAEEPIPMRW
jgi:hypothetical protein